MTAFNRREFGALTLAAVASRARAIAAIDPLGDALHESMNRRLIPAVAAVVATPDKILWSGASGKRDSKSGTAVKPDSIFAMAESFIHPDTPPELAAFRKWQLGVYGSIYGRPDAGKLLKEAAEIRPVFEPELKLFEGASGK